MTNQNIVRDYTKNNLICNQELAVMPAILAEKLLQIYAKSLTQSTAQEIIGAHMDRLRKCKTVDESVAVSIDYTNERVLINNINVGNWGVYDIEPEAIHLQEKGDEPWNKPEEFNYVEEGIKHIKEVVKVVGKLNFETREVTPIV